MSLAYLALPKRSAVIVGLFTQSSSDQWPHAQWKRGELLRGAFWQCLAHKRYRDRAAIVGEPKRKRKIEGTRRNVLDWLKERFEVLPHLEAPLEKESGGILDIVTPLFESKVLLPAVPSLKMMVEQLSVWKMFEPIADPLAEIYDDLYGSLCEDTHLFPGKTMMGRLMVAGKNPSTVFEPSQEEFDRFWVYCIRLLRSER